VNAERCLGQVFPQSHRWRRKAARDCGCTNGTVGSV
jgi:hypothetical protein